MAKIAIVTLMPSFLENLKKGLEEAGHELKQFMPITKGPDDYWRLTHLCEWADVIFCEFCQWPMDIVTNLCDKPVIARLWRCEVYNSKFLNTINWEKVDHLLVATDNMKEKFLKLRDKKLKPKKITTFYGPYIDLEKFSFVEREFKAPYKVVIAGNVIPRKGALEAVRLLGDNLENFKLSIVGNIKDKEYGTHIQDCCKELGIENKVKIYGEIPHDSMHLVMQDHDIVLGMSAEETAHYAIGEGMATGCYPIMLHWKDSDKIYPGTFKSYRKLQHEFFDWEATPPKEKLQLSKQSREWAEGKFDCRRELEEILNALDPLL